MRHGTVPEPLTADEPVFDAVIAAARTGADWALAALYRQFQPAVLRYLRARVPGQEEDVASDVWLAVARGLCGFEGGESDFARWIFTIARRRAVDLGRKSQRRRTDAAAPEEFASVPGGVDPQEALEARAAGDDAVARIVALLPKSQADVVLLRVVAGLSVTETAEVLGCSANRVSVTQHRALRALARKLGPGGALSWVEDSELA
jgi:RNA polymerase sigma-70 factor (ECF subfamily)